MKCRVCKHDCNDDANYCGRCGYKFSLHQKALLQWLGEVKEGHPRWDSAIDYLSRNLNVNRERLITVIKYGYDPDITGVYPPEVQKDISTEDVKLLIKKLIKEVLEEDNPSK